ncbi:EAL domain-containing protein [Thalassotalea nanhaiensis]|uniref:EAL domain-containing protein n=1 Tax=Thalassotalea nanhaiensis TaxID=3065648 RepID=A0ABY9THN6_9GAMM|nr:EAL domain-containing protein [Colwelliaceae bacterium SQ345]
MTTKLQHQLDALKKEHYDLKVLQDALYELSESTFTSGSIEQFYQQVHQIVNTFIDARNFFIAFTNDKTQTLDFSYHVDEKDTLTNYQMPQSYLSDSLSRLVLTRGRPLLMQAKKFERLLAKGIIKERGNMAVDWLGVPLIKNNNIVGLMVIQSYNNDVRYKAIDKEIMSITGQHIISALSRFEYKEQLQYDVNIRTRELEEKIGEIEKIEAAKQSLYEISDLSQANLDLETFYKEVHTVIGKYLFADNFYIARVCEKRETLRFAYFADSAINDHESLFSPRKFGQGLTDYLINSGQPQLLSKQHIRELIRTKVVDIKSGEAHSWLGVPLYKHGEIIGAMVVQSYSKAFSYSDKDADFLNFVSQHVSIALFQRELAILQQQSRDELEIKVKQRTEELVEEITQRQLAEQQLKYSANHDSLTELPNRSYFNKILEHKIANVNENKNYNFALLFIDLDRFKTVNDSLGHHAGDKLLKNVANKIKKLIRNNDILARLGGDEFVVLLDEIPSINVGIRVSDEIIETLSQHIYINESMINIGASIGIVASNQHYSNAEDMLRDADTAMYKAKEFGKGRYELFNSNMHHELLASIKLELDIKTAIKNQEFIPYFQPIYNLNENKIVGFEALARWQSSERGLTYPNEFIAKAEETGLIHNIDLEIIEQSAKILRLWQKKFKNDKLFITCNLFSGHFINSDLTLHISRIISKYQIPKNSLRLELTERALLENGDLVNENMTKLKELGVKLLLDDFGTGYSSLSYLYKFPFDTLKIDRSFINNMREDKKQAVMIKTIIDMAEHLGMSVVAEGIEHESEVRVLTEMGCQSGQGFYYSKPLAQTEIEQVIQSHI